MAPPSPERRNSTDADAPRTCPGESGRGDEGRVCRGSKVPDMRRPDSLRTASPEVRALSPGLAFHP
eukprot:5414599-Pyramimonas_sp.AAC.1